MKLLIIIPTLNEEKNISLLLKKIIKLKIKLTVLIIDDNSEDLTRKIITSFHKKYTFIKYIYRSKRLGIGSAHKEGFKWAIQNKFDFCITMDADLTHNPIMIKNMLKIISSKKYSIINTSRFIKKNSLEGWPLSRKLLTYIRFYLVKILLSTKFDSSGGFRCYNLKKIKSKLLLAKNNSYFFLIESLFYLEKSGFKITEISITLPYRLYGSSKMRVRDIIDSLLNLFKLRIKFFFQK